jgi:NADPH-dependent curcumin reductase CurA
MQGMVVFDYTDRFPQAVAELAGDLREGRLKSREDVVQGLDKFPEALNGLFTGRNFGKLVLQVAQDEAVKA